MAKCAPPSNPKRHDSRSIVRLKKLMYLKMSHILKSQFSLYLISGAASSRSASSSEERPFLLEAAPGALAPSSEAQVPCTQTALPARPGASRVNLAQSRTGKPRQRPPALRACHPWSHKHWHQAPSSPAAVPTDSVSCHSLTGPGHRALACHPSDSPGRVVLFQSQRIRKLRSP